MKKINDCFDIGEKILEEYGKLREIISTEGINSEQFKECIKNIRELVKTEYATYSLLDSRNMVYDEIANLISIENSDVTPIQNRFSLKLLSIPLSIELPTNKYSLNLSELLPSSEIPGYMDFDLDDILCYYFEFETMLRIEKFLEWFSIADNTDVTKEFINELLRIHQDYKFQLFTLRSSSEIISLHYDFDINKYPKIDYSKLVDRLNIKYNHETRYTKKYLRNKIVEFAKTSINCLSKMDDDIKKDPETYYQYLLHLTVFECYISHLNSKQLDELDDYIDNIKMDNKKRKNSLVIRLFMARKK